MTALADGVQVGADVRMDSEVRIGYPPARPTDERLVLGDGARLRSGTVLYLGSRIGDRFETGHHVVVREECDVGDDVCIWSGAVIDYGCRIGNRVKIHANCYVAQFTEIGADAFLAPGVTIANDLYPGSEPSREVMSGPVIGAGAHLGVNVTVLPFVRIGVGVLVGAGAVVARDLPDGCVAYGSPATVRGAVVDLVPVESRVVPVDGVASRYRLARGTP